MDPFSITIGTLALLGACSKASRTLSKIKDLREAPALIQAVNNEISDLRLILMNIHDHVDRASRDEQTTSRVDGPILQLCASTLNQTRRTILEVESLIQYILLKPENASLVVNKRAFLQHHHRLIELQLELRDFRQRIANISSILGLREVSRIEVILDDVQSNDLRMLLQGQTRIQQTLDHLIDSQSANSNNSCNLPEDTRPQDPGVSDHPAIQVSIVLPTSSQPPKTCTCTRQHTQSQSLLGTLFLGYAATPNGLRGPQMCPYHKQKEFSVMYVFPPWFLNYAVSVKMQFGAHSTIRCSLSIIQIIPTDHAVWDLIDFGDLEAIKVLLTFGHLAITAQAPTGKTLLRVRNPVSPLTCFISNETLISTLSKITIPRQRNSSLIWGPICFVNPCMSSMFLAGPLYRDNNIHRSAQESAWSLILGQRSSPEWNESMKSLFPAPDFEECYGLSTLHRTVLGLENRSVEDYLRHEAAQLNEADSWGRTALGWATFRGDSETTEQLLLYGADCNKATKTGFTPLHYAVQTSLQCVELLMKVNANIHARSFASQWNALHYAVLADLPEDEVIKIVDILIQAGINIDATAMTGESALLGACEFDYPKLMRWLLEHGADPELYDKRGNNALCQATRRNCHAQMSVLLQEYRQDHTKHLVQFGTFMHLVAAFADTGSLRLLTGRLKRRDINAKNGAGLTPVQVALQRRNVDLEWKDAFFTFLRTIDEDINTEPDAPQASNPPQHSSVVPDTDLRQRIVVAGREDSDEEFVEALEFQV